MIIIVKWSREAANFKTDCVASAGSLHLPTKSCNEHGKKNVTDRELLSELFENPIHPLQIHMVPPFVDENSPTFHLQIHGEETGLFKTMNHVNVTFSYACCFHGTTLSI